MNRIIAVALLAVGTCIMSACPPANATPNHYVTMQWNPGGGGPFTIHKNVNGGTFLAVATTTVAEWKDVNVTPNKKFCYYISNKYGRSNTVCAVIPVAMSNQEIPMKVVSFDE